MKTLASCTPTEFLKQTNRIRHHVEHWLKVTKIMELRKRMPERKPEVGTEDEIAKAKEENAALLQEQARQNLTEMLDAIMEEHPEETIQLLAMCCFIEPEDADNHPVAEYLEALNELIGDKAVIRFFTSLGKLGLINT